MAKIVDILANGPSSSFEFFPPKTPAAEEQLEQALLELEPLGPSFVSVTYGAGGSTRERTHDLVVRINRETSMTAMAHLTCAAHLRSEPEPIVLEAGERVGARIRQWGHVRVFSRIAELAAWCG